MEIGWWCQTGVKNWVMSVKWWVMSNENWEWSKKWIQTTPELLIHFTWEKLQIWKSLASDRISLITCPYSGRVESLFRIAWIITSASPLKMQSMVLSSFANSIALGQARSSTVAAKVGSWIRWNKAPRTLPEQLWTTTPIPVVPKSLKLKWPHQS